MNAHQESDRTVLYRVSRLLEFFSATQLHGFFHACQDRRLDITAAFTELDQLTLLHTAERGVCPRFDHMVEAFKAKSGLTDFVIPRPPADQSV